MDVPSIVQLEASQMVDRALLLQADILDQTIAPADRITQDSELIIEQSHLGDTCLETRPFARTEPCGTTKPDESQESLKKGNQCRNAIPGDRI